jgi:hypothetical protein
MRLILLLAVLALGADALLYDGSYTQAVWREASAQVGKLVAGAQDAAQPANRS